MILVGVVGTAVGLLVGASLIVLLGIGTQVTPPEDLGYSPYRIATFQETSSSTVATVTSDRQIMSTTTTRLYLAICNDSTTVVYLGIDADTPLAEDGSNRDIRLNANGGCFEIDQNNLYVGAVRASSTNETSSNLIISESRTR